MRTIASIVAIGLTSLLASAPAAAQTAPPIPQAAPATPLPPEPDGLLADSQQHRNRGLMIAGMVTVGLAAAATVGGIMLVATAPRDCGLFCGLDQAIGGLVMAGLAPLVAGGGAAMWAYGAPAPTPAKSKAAWLQPRVSVGPGAATLTWSF